MLNRIRWKLSIDKGQFCKGAHTCTCFLSCQCPRKTVTLGWPRFLEGLAKHFDICYLGRGTWLLRTNLSNLGLSGLCLRPVSLGPRGSCWPCPPHSIPLAFFFGGIFTSLTDFKIFYNFEILYIVKVHFIFTNAAKCKQTNFNWKYCPVFHLIWPFMANMSR